MKLFNNKKAQGINYAAVTIMLLVFGFLSIIMYVIYFQFTQGLVTAGLYTGVAQETGDKFLSALAAFDYLIVFFMMGLLITVGVTSYRLATAPVFFLITLIMGIFWGFISYVFNYVFIKMIEDPNVQSALVHFPRTILVCTNLHWVALAAIIIGSVTLYAKKPKGQFLT